MKNQYSQDEEERNRAELYERGERCYAMLRDETHARQRLLDLFDAYDCPVARRGPSLSLYRQKEEQ